MVVMVKTLGYLSHKGGTAAGGIRKLKAHLKYLEFGKIHENQPKGFTRDGDMQRTAFLDKIDQQPERGVIAHKFVFSLSQDERDRLGVSLRDVVNDVMSAWETKLGRELSWIAFEHEDKGHPHVHVVVGGYAGGKQLGVYQRDLDWLRRTADKSKDALRSRETGLGRDLTPRQDADRLLRQVEAQRLDRSAWLDRLFRQEREIDRGR